MLYIRYLGLLCIAAAGAACGLYASMQLKSRAVLLEKYLVFLKDAEIRVRFGQCAAYEILSSDYENKTLSFILRICRKNLDSGRRFDIAWTEALSDAQRLRLIAPRERQLLSEFSSFGTSDIDGELSRLEMHRERAEEHYKYLAKECADKGKLYRTLGVFGGTAAALIIW